jgi:hypothetical protein
MNSTNSIIFAIRLEALPTRMFFPKGLITVFEEAERLTRIFGLPVRFDLNGIECFVGAGIGAAEAHRLYMRELDARYEARLAAAQQAMDTQFLDGPRTFGLEIEGK